MIEYIKKNWWVLTVAILFAISVPIIINFLLQIDLDFPIIGNSTNWLDFYSSYIGAIIGVSISLFVLYVNKKDSDQKHNELLEYQINFNRYIFEKAEYDNLCSKIDDVENFIFNFSIDSEANIKSLELEAHQIRKFRNYFSINVCNSDNNSSSFKEHLLELIAYFEKINNLNLYSLKAMNAAKESKKLDPPFNDEEYIKYFLTKAGIEVSDIKYDETIIHGERYKKRADFDRELQYFSIWENFNKSSYKLLREKRRNLDTVLKEINHKK